MSAPELSRALAALGEPRVLIVGDLILDRYVSGDVTRISPEAPIPILAAKRDELRLGGAGNVAWNLRAMDCPAEVVGVIGADGWGKALCEELAEIGVDVASCVLDETRPTIQKTRMMSGVQQMLRVDWEDPRPVGGEAHRRVLAFLPERIAAARAVVLSDYGKGLCTPEVIAAVVGAARATGVPVLVDPKGTDYARYRGATLLTPNRREAEQAVGRALPTLADVQRAAAELIELAELDSIVVTLGSDGVYYRTADGHSAHVPAQARAVFDVTGAGDTVVAQLALFLGDGADLGIAVALANQAAAIVVARLGTYAVSRRELAAQLEGAGGHRGKVLAPGDVEVAVAAWRGERKRVVFTNGCFDVLHAGHVDYLRFAASKGDVLLVGVNDDASVRRLKGDGRPVNPIEDRLTVLAALEMVDAVVPFGEDTPLALIERVTPDALVKGEDWADKGVVGREWVEAHGGEVHLAPLVPGRSTTSILERARHGDAAGRREP